MPSAALRERMTVTTIVLTVFVSPLEQRQGAAHDKVPTRSAVNPFSCPGTNTIFGYQLPKNDVHSPKHMLDTFFLHN